MEVVMQHINNGIIEREIFVSDNEVFLVKNNKKKFISCDYEKRFNTLINLFGLKSEWVDEESEDPSCVISFKNSKEECSYSFDVDLPSNFLLFNSCIIGLLGDNYE